MTGAASGAATSTSAGNVEATSTDSSGSGSAQATDQALIILLNTVRGEAVFTTAGPARSMETATIPVPSDYSGEDVEVFLGFNQKTALRFLTAFIMLCNSSVKRLMFP